MDICVCDICICIYIPSRRFCRPLHNDEKLPRSTSERFFLTGPTSSSVESACLTDSCTRALIYRPAGPTPNQPPPLPPTLFSNLLSSFLSSLSHSLLVLTEKLCALAPSKFRQALSPFVLHPTILGSLLYSWGVGQRFSLLYTCTYLESNTRGCRACLKPPAILLHSCQHTLLCEYVCVLKSLCVYEHSHNQPRIFLFHRKILTPRRLWLEKKNSTRIKNTKKCDGENSEKNMYGYIHIWMYIYIFFLN